MAKSLEDARKKLDDEYGQVRRHFDDIHKALDAVEQAGPEDELERLLGELEDAVKKVRTGGLVGHGANGHTRARKEYLQIKQG
ncbi:hypothetical protein KSP35_10065 [Aquihabitans sp. G128]|uniref:hypothetical protein n=1 Tax=Aquihabitans sp. G128 TaxID=2849779 RepID=UPI001C24D8D1|nr:hypothetical protein [Aquihabitans sp. G128]QXC63089.1 hypothetical protein KSP35_10065 [Aquihabitans sp. G128]